MTRPTSPTAPTSAPPRRRRTARPGDRLSRLVAWWDRHQVPLYLAAILAGALLGLAVPWAAPALGASVTPVLALLLFATFLAVPSSTWHGRSPVPVSWSPCSW